MVAAQEARFLASPYGYQCSNFHPGLFTAVCTIPPGLPLYVRIFCFFHLSLGFNTKRIAVVMHPRASGRHMMELRTSITDPLH